MKCKEWWISGGVNSGDVSLCSTNEVCGGGGGGGGIGGVSCYVGTLEKVCV